MKKLLAKIKDAIVRFFVWAKNYNWVAMAKKILNRIGVVMHKILFSWLLPKKYRNITKREIFEIIFKSDTPAGKKFDVWLLIAIAANIGVLILDSLFGNTSTITSGVHGTFSFWIVKALEWCFTILFTFEYYLRIYCLKHPMKYVLSFWGIIDFLSIFPAYLSLFIPATQALTVLRLLRVMRVFRIYRLQTFQDEAYHLLMALRNSATKILIFMSFVLVAAVILGTLMYSFEADRNPAFDSVLAGIYWAVVTITTVGYGDIAPITPTGRFLSVIVMLLGYSIIAVPTGIVAGETIVEHKKKRKRSRPAVLSDYDDEDEAIRN